MSERLLMSSSALMADLASAISRATALNLHQPVGQLVAVERARRKVRSQHGAALLDRGDEAVAGAAVLDACNQRGDRLLPDRRRHLGIDAGVGHDLGIVLGGRGKNEDAGALFGAVEPLREELA